MGTCITQETKQADMWDKIDKKEAEQEAMTAADRRKLEAAKEDVNEEIKLLEEKIQLAEMVILIFVYARYLIYFLLNKTNFR